MTTQTEVNSFPDLPPFPDTVQTAPLLRLSLEKLLSHDEVEIQRLFQACVEIGFFYLNLEDSKTGSSLLKDADHLFQVGEKLFDLDLDEKKKYDFTEQKSYFGYKAQGANYADKNGNLDRNEFYNVCPPTLQIDTNRIDSNKTRSPKTTSWV